MSIKGVGNSGIKHFDHAETNRSQPKLHEPAQPQTQEGRDSKIGNNNFIESTLRFRLQNASRTGSSSNATGKTVLFKQTVPPNPYSNKSADSIAKEEKAKYEAASNKQQAAEDTGRIIADIAKYDPTKALEVSHQILGDKNKFNEGGILGGDDKDELAQETVRALSDDQLKQIAGTQDGKVLLTQMQQHLLDGRVFDDEAQDANRIRTALDSTSGIFTGADQGIVPGSAESVTPVSPDATPEQGANFLKMEPFMTDGSKASMFADALEMHKNDPEWNKKFLSALGSEKTAKYLSDLVNPASYPGGYPEAMKNSVNKVLSNLEILRQNGSLTQESMNGLVNAMQKNGFNPYLATDVFANSSPEMKEMFVKAAIQNGDDALDAAASQVLTTMSGAKQAEILNSLTVDDQGNPDDSRLKKFIEGAMAGQVERVPLSDSIKNPNASWDQSPHITIGGVGKLLELAKDKDLPYPPYIQKSPFSPQLQEKLFKSIAHGLTNEKAFANFKDNTKFKDELSNFFIKNGKDILKAEAPDGAYGDKDFLTGMTKFCELTLFSENGGEMRGKLMESIVKLMSNVGDATKAPPISQTDYENTHNGWSQQDHVEAMGGLMGMVWQAASNQKTAIQGDIAKREETAKFLIGMAFSFVPGAGDVLGKIAGEGSSFIQQIPDKLISFTWDKGKDLLKDEAQDRILSTLKGLNGGDALSSVDKLMDQFSDSVIALNASLPNGEEGELNLRSAFQSAFSFYKNLVNLS